MAATPSSQPVSAYLLLLIFGFLPIIFVSLFYDDLPHRLVVQWGVGGVTITGTRARSAMTIAIVCAGISLFAVVIAAVQNESFKLSGIRRLFLALNFAQVVTIGLTVAMLVTEALGFPLHIRDAVPPSAAVMLTAAGFLCLRIAGTAAAGFSRSIVGAAGWLFLLGAIAILALTVLFIGTPLSFAALALAVLVALLLAIPEPAAA